jgi:hypothetical protein
MNNELRISILFSVIVVYNLFSSLNIQFCCEYAI